MAKSQVQKEEGMNEGVIGGHMASQSSRQSVWRLGDNQQVHCVPRHAAEKPYFTSIVVIIEQNALLVVMMY